MTTHPTSERPGTLDIRGAADPAPHWRGLIGSLCLLLLVSAGLALATAVRAQSPTRVLFVGNSYTYFNNLPELVVQAAAARHQAVEARMVAPGGWRLKDHWEKGDALPALHESRWDYVVLQDQSTLGLNYFVDGKPRVSSDEIFRPYADKWAAEVRKAGATPVFYLTWARKASPEDQAALNAAYIRAAKAGDARVAPVGIAWAEVRREHPSIELFFPDGSHPSAAGSYLAACTVYAALFNRSPVGLPGTIRGAPVNLETGAPEHSGTVALVDVPADDALELQVAAWRAWKKTGKPSFFKVAPVMPPTVALPAGKPFGPAKVAGVWKGSFALYPSARTDMVLRLDYDDAAGWRGHLGLRYNAKDATDQSFDLADLHVDEREITFTNPSAWQGLLLRFRGVSPRAGVLRGTVEATRPNADTPIRLLGSWELRKQ